MALGPGPWLGLHHQESGWRAGTAISEAKEVCHSFVVGEPRGLVLSPHAERSRRSHVV